MFPIRSAVPYRYAPVVTWAVIVANCVVFLAQTSLDPADLQALVYAFGLVPARYLGLFSGGSGGPRLDDLLPFFTMMFLAGLRPLPCVLSLLRRRGVVRAYPRQPRLD
jgi:membrane associated rhomboid family serine protease